MTLLTYDLPDPAATHALGVSLGRSLPPSTVLLLEGNLGSGKTTLVQGIGVGLGIVDPIVSPTFTLINEYLEGRIPLYHSDLYRLQPNEVVDLNLQSYWQGIEVAPGIVAIEWSERLPMLPPRYLLLQLVPTAQGGRVATIKGVGDWQGWSAKL
ncbi:MAG: tRNA (adenosine(37)-N6)-threonylcarbamoyltransferase complex ATPase subunit type 1 TsaE [Leptolyngbyaceae cyanobacterium SL_7_1]|nr:tRNA (adenosine(37)-N6)-threonylcarbamoyltransferase complex ATPase subunit type 1 TsaE [Leptolyngbyaceae cyanobacterium SL_7_1]